MQQTRGLWCRRVVTAGVERKSVVILMRDFVKEDMCDSYRPWWEAG